MVLVKKHPEHEFIFFFDRDFDTEFLFASNIKGVKLFPPARHAFLFVWFFEWSIYRALIKHKADLYISCDGFLSLRSKVPQIAVIHDLSFEHNPEDLHFFSRQYYKFFFPRFARKAKHILTVSEFSKKDIVERYEIQPDKITVVYNGASSNFTPIGEEFKTAVRMKFSESHDYFVYVGALQPRKNIARLLLAFDAFKEGNPNSCKLVIVGRMAWKTESIEEAFAAMKFKDDVLFTGRISDEDLTKVLASAIALVYIPYLEGFGIPILESMQCGTPVITSNISAMPEVAGDAGLLINPFDVNEIKQAFTSMYFDAALREQLLQKCVDQSKKFSWEKTADCVWKAIINCSIEVPSV